MGTEAELKLELTTEGLRKLRASRVLPRNAQTEEQLTSIYFDTPKHKPLIVMEG